MSVEEARATALAHAVEMWRARPDFRPLAFLPHHDCRRDECAMIEIPYVAKREGDSILVALSAPAAPIESAIGGLTPLYGCPATNAVHPCGELACEYGRDELTCPLTGVELGQRRRDAKWAPYKSENSLGKVWRLDVRARRAADSRVGAVERLEAGDGSLATELDSAPSMLVAARRRARSSTKSDAFDIAFAICAIVLSKARFADALRRNRAQRANRLAQAMRAAQRLQQRQVIVSARGIAKAIPCAPEPVPVLLLDDETRLQRVIGYAHMCVALWHVLYSRIDASVRDMGFRDFCVAALSLFSRGHVVVNARSGLGRVFASQDMLLSVFAVNGWAEREIYSDVVHSKIAGITGRSSARLVGMINESVARDKANTAYLAYEGMPYAEIGEGAFQRLKR